MFMLTNGAFGIRSRAELLWIDKGSEVEAK